MAMYSIVATGATTSATVTKNSTGGVFLEDAYRHQIRITETGGSGTGVYAVTVIPLGASTAETATVGGTALTITCSGGKGSATGLEGFVSSIIVTKSSGDSTSFDVAFAGGEG